MTDEIPVVELQMSSTPVCGCRRKRPWYKNLWYRLHPRRIWYRNEWRVRHWFWEKFVKNELRHRWYYAFHERPKLRATWSVELAQDLKAYHSFDAEDELTKLLTEEINREIVRDIWNQEWQSKYSLPGIDLGSILRRCSSGSLSFQTARYWYTEPQRELTLLRELWVPSWDLSLDLTQPTGLSTDEQQVLLETGLCLTPRPRILSLPFIIPSPHQRALGTW